MPTDSPNPQDFDGAHGPHGSGTMGVCTDLTPPRLRFPLRRLPKGVSAIPAALLAWLDPVALVNGKD